MKNLQEHAALTSKLKKNTPKKQVRIFLFIFIFSMFIFAVQFYFLYYNFIPNVVSSYEDFPELQTPEFVRASLEKVLGHLLIWPIMFFSVVGVLIYNSMKLGKLLDSESSK